MVKREFECRNCGNREYDEQDRKVVFCTKCGTKLGIRPPPKHWLFQFNPSIYRWFDRIKETREPEQWLINQYIKLILKDDLIAVWCSGKQAGIYALGQVISIPARSFLNPNQEKYFLNKSDIVKFQEHLSAYVEYDEVYLENPLLQEQCREDNVLSEMQVFVKPQGTNFRLTPEQWRRIAELIA